VRPTRYLLAGDARQLPLASASVHCIVTSPPYWGLRNYDVAGQVGLEPTPELYVQHLVEIFREVRRVLRPDGTCWVNLGSSYASGDMNPSRSLGDARALAYGSDDRARQDSQEPDSVYLGLCDGCRVVLASDRSVDMSRFDGRSLSLGELKGRDNGLLDSGAAFQCVLPLDGSASTMLESAPPPRGACSHCANCGACLAVLRSSSRDGRLCGYRRADRVGAGSFQRELQESVGGSRSSGGIAGTVGASGARTSGTDVDWTAWFKYTFKPKDMVPIPWMVAMALQADGWYLRCDVIWAKPNPMPESITDRPTKSHEYLFLLTKSARYYYDGEAIKEPSLHAGRIIEYDGTQKNCVAGDPTNDRRTLIGVNGARSITVDSSRHRRSVWTIATEAFPGSHFATFPEKLIEPCILAGTSERGACRTCEAPWERVIQGTASDGRVGILRNGRSGVGEDGQPLIGDNLIDPGQRGSFTASRGVLSRETLRWSPTCACPPADPVPCRILDPFAGSGTTVAVAERLGRVGIGVELKAAYLRLAWARTRQMVLL
jgi:DNA modification methylase